MWELCQDGMGGMNLTNYHLLDTVLSIDDCEDAREWATVYSDRQAAAAKNRMIDLEEEELARAQEATALATRLAEMGGG